MVSISLISCKLRLSSSLIFPFVRSLFFAVVAKSSQYTIKPSQHVLSLKLSFRLVLAYHISQIYLIDKHQHENWGFSCTTLFIITSFFKAQKTQLGTTHSSFISELIKLIYTKSNHSRLNKNHLNTSTLPIDSWKEINTYITWVFNFSLCSLTPTKSI